MDLSLNGVIARVGLLLILPAWSVFFQTVLTFANRFGQNGRTKIMRGARSAVTDRAPAQSETSSTEASSWR